MSNSLTITLITLKLLVNAFDFRMKSPYRRLRLTLLITHFLNKLQLKYRQNQTVADETMRDIERINKLLEAKKNSAERIHRIPL
jgi:hypothetical protein